MSGSIRTRVGRPLSVFLMVKKEDGWSGKDEYISAPLSLRGCVCTRRCVMSAFVRCQHVESTV